MGVSSDQPLQSNQLPLSIDFSEDPVVLRETLTDTYKRTVDSMNTKVGGLYPLQEVASFKRFFTEGEPFKYRNIYRKTFVVDPAVLNFPHNIPGIVFVTEMYGVMLTSQPDWRPIPFTSASLVTDQVSLKVTTTNIVIVKGATAPAIVEAFVVLEYVKN